MRYTNAMDSRTRGIGIAIAFVILTSLWVYNEYGRAPALPFNNDNSTSMMASSSLTLTSSAFADGESIPAAHTCDGEQTSPPLSIQNVPAGTVSLVLLVDDSDVPKELMPSGVFDHWVLYNIPPQTTEIPAGGTVGIAGVNTRGQSVYAPPCPPKQYEPSEHRYVFRLFALNTKIDLPLGAKKADVLVAIRGHVLADTSLTGTYKRP